MNEELIEAAKAFVENVYATSEKGALSYHNWIHTDQVCTVAMEIAENLEDVSVADKEILALAGLFHDVGYTIDPVEHEQRSAEMAIEFLTERGYDSDKIATVKRVILATVITHEPTDRLEEIIRDADSFHIGTEKYLTSTYIYLYKEMKKLRTIKLSKLDWAAESSEFFKKHKFYTSYAKEVYDHQKAENLNKLTVMIENLPKDAELSDEAILNEKKEKKEKKKKKDKEKSDLPEKGVETMFRVALRNHMNLSRIADSKANTLISVNGIIITIAISTLFPKLDSNPYLIYPGLGLIIFSIVTIIIAILSTIPKTTGGRLSKKEVEEKKGNLIFFGNFHKMSLEDYEWSIGELMKDRDYLYKSLTRDLYFLGKVLNRKYNLLRWAYYLFVTGLIVTIGLSIYSTIMI